MRSLLVFVLTSVIGLAGCDVVRGPEEVRACEAFIKGQLRSPTTYKQAKVTVGDDEALSQADFNRLYVGEEPDELAQILKLGTEGKQLGLRRVFVEYDADNAYGTPVRGLNMCEFLVIEGKLDAKGNLESKAEGAASKLQLQALSEQFDSPELKRLHRRHGESTSDCCVRY